MKTTTLMSYPSLKNFKFKSLLKYSSDDDWSTITVQYKDKYSSQTNYITVQHALQSMTFFLEYIQLHTGITPHSECRRLK